MMSALDIIGRFLSTVGMINSEYIFGIGLLGKLVNLSHLVTWVVGNCLNMLR